MSRTDTPTRPTAAAAASPAPPAALGSLAILRLVTMRELVERGRTKSFIISTIVSLLLLGAAIVLPGLSAGGDLTYAVGSLGEGNDSILRVTEATAREQLGADVALTFDATTYDSEEAAQAALASGDVELVLVNGERILREGSVGFSGSDLQDAVQQAAAVAQLEAQLEGSGTSVEEVAATFGGEPLPVTTVEGETDADQEAARSIIAYGGMFLLYIAILTFGNWTLMGIAEEKASRVVEVLLATVKPWQLLSGKILGIGALGLAQFAVTVVWALVLVRVTGALELPVVPVDSAVALVLWFVLGYATYSVAFAMAGALVSRMEDAQTASFPVTMVVMIGFIASFSVLDDPSGLVARITTFVPFISPFVVPIRVAYSEIAVWEQLLSIGVTLVAIALLVRLAGRVYAGGLLHFGGRMKLRQAWNSSRG